MTKRELKRYLEKMRFVELDNDEFLFGSRKFDTFTVYKDSVLIHAGYKLYFAFDFSRKRSVFDNYSAVCVEGYELDTLDNDFLFSELKLFCDCKKSESDFLNELKAIK